MSVILALWFLQIDGLDIYGGLKRVNQRESKSGSLMLKLLQNKDLQLSCLEILECTE